MSTPNPTHIIAEGMREVATEGQKGTPGTREDGQLWGAFPNTMTLSDLAAYVVSELTDAGYSIVHHRATCSESGDNCKHLPNCVVAVCICGDDWPCPVLAAAAEGEKP